MLVPLLLLLGIEAYYFKKADKENAIDWTLCGEKFGSLINSNTMITVHLSYLRTSLSQNQVVRSDLRNKIMEQLGPSGLAVPRLLIYYSNLLRFSIERQLFNLRV